MTPASRSTRAVLSLGANIGDRLAALQGAVDALVADDDVEVVAVSHVYSTEPVGGPEQDDFLNAVALIDTDLSPHDLLALAHRIEADHHRTREVRWGPRTLDVDLINLRDSGVDIVMDTPELTLPHPRAYERAFVCVPWADVEPSAVSVELDASGVQRTDLELVIR
jgi:2-amino-4-hydroxy-6-hydroxymethyldihydropteridine diphosphokinase